MRLFTAPATSVSTCQGRQLSTPDVLTFERRGFLVVRDLVHPDRILNLQQEVQRLVLARRLHALQHRVRVLCPGVNQIPNTEKRALQLLQRHAVDSVGFLQFFNTWQTHDSVRAVVFSEELTSVAAQLLGVSRLRLYQDCVFYKEPGFSETNWHSDLRMTPLDTNDFVTAWIPLRDIRSSDRSDASDGGDSSARRTAESTRFDSHSSRTCRTRASDSSRHGRKGSARCGKRTVTVRNPSDLPDSGLLFAVASHRDFSLPFWYDVSALDLTGRYQVSSTGSMEVGDVSFHHGWTLHAAGPQPPTSEPRAALAVSYFADGARIRRLRGAGVRPTAVAGMGVDEDSESYNGWLRDLKEGALASHPLLPVVYPVSQGQQQEQQQHRPRP